MATITDVAKKAGVSIATVSYVLNGRTDLVREETADRIRRAAEELNYSASPVARSLATGASYTVAVVLPDHSVFSHPIGSQEFLGVAEEFYMSNYSLLIKPSHTDARMMKSPHVSIPRHVAGVLVLGPMSLDNPDLAEARSLNKPTVVVEDVPEDWGVTCVNADNFHAARMVTDHLIRSGRRRIGLVSQKRISACMERRILGYTDALLDHGIVPDKALHRDVRSHEIDHVAEVVEDLILSLAGDSAGEPGALIVLNSALLAGVAEAIRRAGLAVPRQIAVGCVDYGMPPDLKLEWPVVTLSVDLRHQGELAARTLVEMLKSKQHPAQNCYIMPQLTVLEP